MLTSAKLGRTWIWSLLGCLALNACAAAPPPEDSEPTYAGRRHSRRESDDDEAAQNGAPADTNATPVGEAQSAPAGSSGGGDENAAAGNPCQPGATTANATGTGGTGVDGRPAASTASIGTPAGVLAQERALVPRWHVQEGHGRIMCEGALDRARPYCPQCPALPSNASIVRTFVPMEREVLECEPPSNEDGRLAVRADFSGAGMPIAISFPGVHLRRRQALCLGEAFCRMRMPTLRSPEATVSYEYVVLLPAPPQAQ